MATFKDLTGQRFGRLVVVSLENKQQSGNRERYYWRCKCDCGKDHVVRTDGLTSGGVQSCGCLHVESAIKNVSKHHSHKQSRTPIYETWQGMKKRCFNPNCKCYSRYGGRGITVCDEWRNNFQAFYDYVSKLEHFGEEGYTLDRIDNDGDYAPCNVRWADAKRQCRNRRSNVVVDYHGESMTVMEAAEHSGINYGCLTRRIKRNVDGGDIFRPAGENAQCYAEIDGRKYTAKEIARIAGVKVATIYRRFKSGKRDVELFGDKWFRNANVELTASIAQGEAAVQRLGAE